jgi:hypothetical protein
VSITGNFLVSIVATSEKVGMENHPRIINAWNEMRALRFDKVKASRLLKQRLLPFVRQLLFQDAQPVELLIADEGLVTVLPKLRVHLTNKAASVRVETHSVRVQTFHQQSGFLQQSWVSDVSGLSHIETVGW